MINLLDVESTLAQVGYRPRIAKFDSTILLFEDESILGFVSLFETVEQLLDNWKSKQNQFVSRMAVELRRSASKSWNCYAVFLALDEADPDQRALLSELEEDLSLTRKLVVDGLLTARDIPRALLPILPIQNRTSTTDLGSQALSSRLPAWPRTALLALEGDGTPIRPESIFTFRLPSPSIFWIVPSSRLARCSG